MLFVWLELILLVDVVKVVESAIVRTFELK